MVQKIAEIQLIHFSVCFGVFACLFEWMKLVSAVLATSSMHKMWLNNMYVRSLPFEIL